MGEILYKRELSSVVEFLPQSHNIILPVDHLSKDQNNRNGRETHQQKERVRSLHHIQTLLMSYNLKMKTDRAKGRGLADSIQLFSVDNQTCMTVTAPYVTADQ